jgi:tRNA dimethylallyltransferase
MPDNSNVLLVISGPTAVGKTALTLSLGVKYDSEIISADSRQVYREMSIGTAKPNADELSKVKHHFIDHLSIHEPYDAGRFEKEALLLLQKYFEAKNLAILSGGTGLYIKAVVDGLDEFPEVPEKILEEVKKDYAEKGILYLQTWLQKHDAPYYEKVDISNPHRLIRAISVIRHSQRPFSSFLGRTKKEREFRPLFLLLTREREALYRRIDQRVDQMIEKGLLSEVEALFPHRHLKSLQTVGYQELFAFLEGKHSKERAIELIKRNSRRYAKRQMTWFRKDDRWKIFDADDLSSIATYIEREIAY